MDPIKNIDHKADLDSAGDGTYFISDNIYYNIFEKLQDMICISTPDDRILDANPVCVKTLGYDSKEDFLSIDNLQYLFHSIANMKKWKELMRKLGSVKNFEATLVKKSGELIAAHVTSSRITNQSGKIIYTSVIRDITENIKGQTNIHKQNVDLIDSISNIKKTQPKLIQQEKLASIGQLAAGIAHELNNPIGFISSNFTSLKSYVNIIKKYIEQFEEIASSLHSKENSAVSEIAAHIDKYKKEQKLDYIFEDIGDLVSESMEGIHRITGIVRNLRNFSRIDVDSEIEQYDINGAIESTLIVAKNEIKYVADIKRDYSQIPPVHCIGGEINQVFLNIIVNAAQSIKSQTRSIRGVIKIKTYNDKEFVYCEITDNGPGIPDKIVHRIFDPFFTTKEAGKGTGLGLNISYDIVVHKHNGDLLVKSKEGVGTKFIIKIPIESRIEK
jgi:PAS domain S-box-containing protein